MDEDNEKIDDAIARLAFGGENKSLRVRNKKAGDKVVASDQVAIKSDIPPNPEFLKMLYDNRIGGPEDWC